MTDRQRRHGRDPRGFSLVEILAAITIAGILAGGVVTLLQRQNEFYGKADDIAYAEESLRASADLAAAELRMSSGPDLIRTIRDTVSTRFDVLRAVVCDTFPTGTVTIFVFHEDQMPSLPGGATGTAFSGPYEAGFHYGDAWMPTVSATGGAAKSVCTGFGAPADRPPGTYRTLAWSGHPDGRPPPGSVVRLYGTLTYSLRASNFAGGLALWRNDQELAGPFDPGRAEFRYEVCTGGGCVWKSDVTDASERRQVERIRLVAEALGDGANRYGVRRDMKYEIALRN